MMLAKNLILNTVKTLARKPAITESFLLQARTFSSINHISKNISYSTRTYASKWPEQWPVDVRFERECLHRKCRQLFKTPNYGVMHCSKSPELNTHENRTRYCREPVADSYDCHNPPRNKERSCVLKCKIYLQKRKVCVPKAGGQCGHKLYSTQAGTTKDPCQYEDDILGQAFSKENRTIEKSEDTRFKCQERPKYNKDRILAIPLGIRKFSTFSGRKFNRQKVRKHFSCYVQKAIKFFKARPNCPTVEEYKRQKLIQKAQRAAKAAGLQLCTPQASNQPRSQPKQLVTASKNSEKNCKPQKCPKMCLPGCKPPADRINCVMDEVKPPCNKMETPYASFSDMKTWEFSRPRPNECGKWEEIKFWDDLRKMKMIPREKKYSTFAPIHAISPNLIVKREMSTKVSMKKENLNEAELNECCKQRPLELCGTCQPIPFKPPCIDLVPGQKPPCTPYKLPPCPPPPPKVPPCPVRKKPKKVQRCGLPPGPPECLIDRCKRYRECCREPPKPKVCPCEETC